MIFDDIPTRLIIDGPFEKWDISAKRELTEKFQKAYNSSQNTDYQITEDSLKDYQDFDFTLTDKFGAILKVQHTSAGTIPSEDRIDPRMQDLAKTILLEKTKDIKNLFISVGFKEFVGTKLEAASIAEGIENFVRDFIKKEGEIKPTEKLTEIFHYRHTDENIAEVPEIIKKYFSHFDLCSNNYSVGLFLGYGGKPRAMLDDMTRASMAINHKLGRYSNPEDLVLIIHYDTPFFDVFIPSIRSEYADCPFRGVWVYAAFEDRFILIK